MTRPGLAISPHLGGDEGVAGHPRRAGVRDWVGGSGLPVVLVGLWEALGALGWIPQDVLPRPSAVIRALVGLTAAADPALGYLPLHVAQSLWRQLAGFGLAIALGVPLGVVLGLSVRLRRYLLPIVQMLYPVPGLAWTPLAILWMGLGAKTVTFLIFISAIWPILYGTIDGFRNIGGRYVRVAQAAGCSRSYYVTHVAIPASLPVILTALRLGFGASWRAIVGAEMLASTSGLGYLLSTSMDARRGDTILLGMCVIGLLGYLIEHTVFDGVDRITVGRWGAREAS